MSLDPNKLSLNFTNFFPHFIIHPKDAEENDQNLTWAISIILGIFTIGLVHLGCVFYEHFSKNAEVKIEGNRTEIEQRVGVKAQETLGNAPDSSSTTATTVKKSLEQTSQTPASVAALLPTQLAKIRGSSQERLWEACEKGDEETVQEFLGHKEEKTGWFKRAVGKLKKHSVDLNARRSDLMLPLDIAAEKGHAKIVQMLIDAGANSCLAIAGKTALHYACKGRHDAVAKILIQDMIKKLHSQKSSIAQSTLFPHIAEYLIARGDASRMPVEGFCNGLTLLYGYYQFTNRRDEFFELLQKSKSISLSKEGLDQKRYDALTEDEKLLEHFFNDIMSLQILSQEYGRTANSVDVLRFISERDEIASLSFQFQYVSYFPWGKDAGKHTSFYTLLEKILEQDPEKEKLLVFYLNDGGFSSAHILGIFCKGGTCELYESNKSSEGTALKCNKENIHLLAKHITAEFQKKGCLIGCDVIANQELSGLKAIKEELFSLIDPGTGIEHTPLLYAVQNGYVEAVNALINKGVDLSQVLLSSAIYAGFPEITMKLIESGIDLEATSATGQKQTPLMYAISCWQFEIAKELIERGVDLNKLDRQGRNALIFALQIACPSGAMLKRPLTKEDKAVGLEIAKTLIAKGANKEAALAYAQKRGFTEIIALLESL